MKILKLLVQLAREHPVAAGAFGLIATLLVAVAIALPVTRHLEIARLRQTAARASQVLVVALANPAVLTGEPDTDLSQLDQSAQELSRLHDEVVLDPVYFAKNAARAALAYTEYTARIGTKLAQVARAQQLARTTFETYGHDVDLLKASNLAGRAAAQEEVNAIAGAARSTTEMAYQECALLVTLTQEYGIIKTHALASLDTVGPEVQPAIDALAPNLHAALLEAHARRRIFNPAARPPS